MSKHTCTHFFPFPMQTLQRMGPEKNFTKEPCSFAFCRLSPLYCSPPGKKMLYATMPFGKKTITNTNQSQSQYMCFTYNMFLSCLSVVGLVENTVLFTLQFLLLSLALAWAVALHCFWPLAPVFSKTFCRLPAGWRIGRKDHESSRSLQKTHLCSLGSWQTVQSPSRRACHRQLLCHLRWVDDVGICWAEKRVKTYINPSIHPSIHTYIQTYIQTLKQKTYNMEQECLYFVEAASRLSINATFTHVYNPVYWGILFVCGTPHWITIVAEQPKTIYNLVGN